MARLKNVGLCNIDWSPQGLAAAADANLALHASWIQQRTPGMHASVADELVLSDCGLACDTFSLVCRARLTARTAASRVRAVVDYFADRRRPFAWWHGPCDQPGDLSAYLKDAGLQPAETELAMAANLRHLRAEAATAPGLAIRRVRTPEALRDFAAVMSANWSPPDNWVLRYFELAAPLLLDDTAPLWQYVGYLGAAPVAISQLTFGGGVVGLYSVCTLEAFRRRGFGLAMTVHPLLEARAAGSRTAILQASAAGAGIYKRVGFEAFGEITEYKPPAS